MAVVTPTPIMQFIDAAGVPLAGGLLYTYAAGTTTPQATYTDSTGATANTNPVVLNARGEAGVWLGSSTYKFKLCDSNGTEIWTVDYISAPTSALSPVLSGNVTIDSDSSGTALTITQTGTGAVLKVQDSVDPDATPFIIDNAGQVGIGTATPSAALDIWGGQVYISSAGGVLRTAISADSTDSIYAVSDNRNFTVKTNGTTRLTLNGSAAAFTTGITAIGNSSVTGTITASAGLTVSSGGAGITGNSTVTGTLTATSTLTAQNGLTVSAGGAGVTGLLTANSGISVPSGGVSVTGTVTATTFSGAWENLPSGTVMLFVQTAAPTGWTKSTTHDNKALRVVSGSASSGGSVNFTTAFASQAVTGTNASYTLTTSDIPSHNHSATSTVTDPTHSHTVGSTQGNSAVGGGLQSLGSSGSAGSTNSVATGITVATSIGNTGGGGGHTHSFTGTAINLAVQYVDVIIATKN
jgi:hypothetical protein